MSPPPPTKNCTRLRTTAHDYAQLSTMVDFMVLSIKLVFMVLGVSYSRVLSQRLMGCCSASYYYVAKSVFCLPGNTWVCKTILEGAHQRTIRCVAWSPCGMYFASVSFDGTTAIWDRKSSEFECSATLEGHENEVKSVSWARGGSLLATCSRDKSVWIWEGMVDMLHFVSCCSIVMYCYSRLYSGGQACCIA